MRRLLRWTAIAVAGLVALGIVAATVVYGLSEHTLRCVHPIPAVRISVPRLNCCAAMPITAISSATESPTTTIFRWVARSAV